MTSVVLKSGSLDTDTHKNALLRQRQRSGDTAEAKEAQGFQQSIRSWKRGWSRLPLSPQKDQPCPHHDLEFLASRTVRKQIPVFKLPGLWYFVRTAPASEYSHLTSYNLQPCPTLCDPMDCSPPGSSVHGILQARILEGVAIPFSRESFQPWDQTWFFHTAGRFFTDWATREAWTAERHSFLCLIVSYQFWSGDGIQAILFCLCKNVRGQWQTMAKVLIRWPILRVQNTSSAGEHKGTSPGCLSEPFHSPLGKWLRSIPHRW